MYLRLVQLTCLLAFVVVVLGAYTRLSHAGLGCPDWPGCYGELTVPASESDVRDKSWLEQRPLEPEKGWKEMVHRYAAGLLGVLILIIAVWSWRRRHAVPEQPVWLPTMLLVLVCFQALLGMWTVTLLLKPVIVMAHLLGGFATLSLLVLLALRVGDGPHLPSVDRPVDRSVGWRPLALAALLVLVGQIALGGWTSANYAALACPDFPMCQGRWLPEMDFGEGFVLWRGTGVNYEFGVLDNPARTAIHVSHRVGAIFTALLLGYLAIRLLVRGQGRLTALGMAVGTLLLAQISLGIGNVFKGLPLGVAAAHNAVAALLLLALVWLNYLVWRQQH